jgi:D-3-phosphoglycerate dehydrogenase
MPTGLPLAIITETLDAEAAGWLEQHARVVWCAHDRGKELDEQLADAAALVVRTYTQVNRDLLGRAPHLKVVGRAGVGLDNIDVAACRRRGVEVVYTPDANTRAVVEYVVGLMLDALRPRVTMAADGAAVTPAVFHEMRRKHVGVELNGMTLGILGFGRIGRRLGRAAHALGMNLLVNDLIPEAELRRAVEYPFTFVDKPALYGGSDVLSTHVDGRPENRGLIDAAALAQLRPTCLLINAARGMLVDNNALAAWARAVEGRGGRVILDVHEPEPPPADYVLYGLANVRLLPHLASRTDRALRNMSWVVRDVAAVLEGRTPEFPAP